MDKNILVLGGVALAAWYFFGREETAAPPASGTTPQPGTGAPVPTTTDPISTTPPPPAPQTALEKLIAKAGTDKGLTAHQWNFYQAELAGQAQPDPASFVPQGFDHINTPMTAADYIRYRGMGRVGHFGGRSYRF